MNAWLNKFSEFLDDIGFISLDFNYSLNLHEFFKRTVNKDNWTKKDF